MACATTSIGRAGALMAGDSGEAAFRALVEEHRGELHGHCYRWCRGREAIAESWLMPEGAPPRLRYVITSANGQPALATYLREGDGDDYRPLALDVLTLRGERIAAVTAFRTPALFHRFGLADPLPRLRSGG